MKYNKKRHDQEMKGNKWSTIKKWTAINEVAARNEVPSRNEVQ